MKLHLLAIFAAISIAGIPGTAAEKKEHKTKAEIAYQGPKVLWREPVDIASRNLFYGPGGKQHQPAAGAFRFIKEDHGGSNPKFVVKDASGVKWKVKMGAEARPETVASRLVWATGYFADEDYFVTNLKVTNMERLRRGQDKVKDGVVKNVRLERESDTDKVAYWKWKQDPFVGTREWNGLRVLMAVMNNWDLKDVNNGVYEDDKKGEPLPLHTYAVSDLGASFGPCGITVQQSASRGNVHSYERSMFIRRVRPDTVDFCSPGRPSLLMALYPPHFITRLHLRWVGRGIPRSDAKWMGDLLGRLSQQQIRDAFRSAGYESTEVDRFSKVLQNRIAELQRL